MNNDLAQTVALISNLKRQNQTSNAEVMIAPTIINLWHAIDNLKSSPIEVDAQNLHLG